VSRIYPSCRHTADDCSYAGEARPGCLRDKQIRDELNAKTKGLRTKELREQIRARWREMEKK
jgi:hypothetical protein